MIYEKLAAIQAQLHAPKNQKNDFGGYAYRSAEDILSAVKPLMDGLVLMITDSVREIGGRVYIKATATLTDGEKDVSVSAYAREPLSRKGVDESQITGAASSYARKYALNGLFAIDNTPDADTKKGPSILDQINSAFTREELVGLWQQMSKDEQANHEAEFTERMNQIKTEQ